MSELYAQEHAAGLHATFAPPGCEACVAAGQARPRTTPAPTPPQLEWPVDPEPGRPSHGSKTLGEALEEIKRKRGGRFFGDGQPPDPEPPESIDGDPYCDTCKGFRWVAQPTPERSTVPLPVIRCPVCVTPWAVQRRTEKFLGALPIGLRDYRLHTFPTPTTVELELIHRLIDWIEDPAEPWLFLHGPTGRGKTGLAVSLLYELVSRGSSGAFKITTDLLTTIKNTFGNRENADSPGELDILSALYTVDLFVLDDLGSEHHRGPDDWATEKIFQVIEGRYVERKRMIITSNANLRELAIRAGHARASSRIIERTNPDWRIDCSALPNLRAPGPLGHPQ